MSNETFYDVVAVGLLGKDRGKVRILDRNLSAIDADATIKMAVIRRGVNEAFYIRTTPGKYNDGDIHFRTLE